jgi:signal peptidase I
MTQEFRKSTLREYFESIVIAVILALFIRTFVVQAFKIPTGSMEETLLIGDHLLVNKFVFGSTETAIERALLPIGTIKRRDVLVFKYPEEPERDFIKRVIGLPGDTVTGCVPGKVCIQAAGARTARPLTESYLPAGTHSDFSTVAPGCGKPVNGAPGCVVPAGTYFVMGDNRTMSQDSRVFGPIKESTIVGRVFLRIWPVTRLSLL